MWDTYRLPTTGNFSLRKIAFLFIAVSLAALSWVIAAAPTAHAADANWDGDAIIKDGNRYVKETAAIPGVPPGHQIYVFKNPNAPTTAQVIYFKDGEDTSKPFAAQQATATLDGGRYTGLSPPTSLTVDAKAAATKKEKTQCDTPGIGWIICPFSRWVAGGMDSIFKTFASFLKVQPLTNDTGSALYKAWSVMLGLANMAFVAAFLVIIYSQITSVGFSNYNIKKMIPRLIVAAILVNISYYVCAFAVDVSNILGSSVQQALVDIRKSLPEGAQSIDALSWKNVTEYILSGGTIAVAGMVGWASFLGGAAGGSFTALAFLLFPILVTGALAVLAALIVLAARQALIIVLIVVAPLAFVAYLLPNTEKWFERWRELFTTMLLMFPLFGLVFGGSQLASYIIMQSASDFSVVLFGLFVQVAPLAITPFLVKFSGSLLGRLAGMVNNPQKGLIDRTRNWANDRAEVRKGAGLKAAARGGGHFFQRRAFKREKDRLNREMMKKDHEAHVDAAWHHDNRYRALHGSMSGAELRKKAGETSAERHFEEIKAQDRTLQRYSGRIRTNEAAIKSLQTQEEAAWEEAKSKSMQSGNRFSAFNQEARQVSQDLNVAETRVASAKAVLREEYGRQLIDSEQLQRAAGGIAGADRALAMGIAEYRKAYGQHVEEANAILKHFNLSSTQRQNHAMGREVVVMDSKGVTKLLRADSIYTREAAIDTQLSQGTVKEIHEIVEAAGTELNGFKTTIQDAVARNKLSQKAVYLGGKTINDIGQGTLVGKAGLDAAVLRTFMDGKISAGDLATNDAEALKRIWEVLGSVTRQVQSGNPPAGLDVPTFMKRAEALKNATYSALNNRSISGSIKDNAHDVLVEMRHGLPGQIDPSAANNQSPPNNGTSDDASQDDGVQ